MTSSRKRQWKTARRPGISRLDGRCTVVQICYHMSLTHPHSTRKALVWVFALSVGYIWVLVFAILLVSVGATIGMTFFHMPSVVSISQRTNHFLLASIIVMIIPGFFAVGLAFCVRCPHCHHLFLKNPKGVGSTGFVYHENCSSWPGINPWAFQVGRFLIKQKIRCINCGEEVFEDGNPAVK